MNDLVKTIKNLTHSAQTLIMLLGPHWIKVPPLAPFYLKTYLTHHGISARVIDLNILFFRLLEIPPRRWIAFNADLENNLLTEIEHRCPELIQTVVDSIAHSKAQVFGFCLFSRNRTTTLNFAKQLHKSNPAKTFVFGGPEVLFEYYRQQFFDEITLDDAYFVLGEGERAFLDICRNKYIHNSSNRELYKNKQLIAYNQLDDLDSLPLLDFDTHHLNLYDSPALALFSSRGCIRRCTFCSEQKLFKGFRQHSASYVVELIEHLQQKFNKHYFSFHDSLINASIPWLEEFCSLLINKNISIQWEAQIAIRPEMKRQLFKLMKKAGCYNLFIGLESGSDKILSAMHKGYSQSIALNFFNELASTSLHYEVSLITGFPSESDDDFNETLEFLKNNKHAIPKIAQINPFVNYSPASIKTTQAHQNNIGAQRVQQLLTLLEKENIKYTRSFINNLTCS